MNTKKITTFLIFYLGSFWLFAQQGTVTNAILYFKDGELDKAKSAIDEACVHEKTKAKPKTWYYKGNIYMAIYISDKPQYKSITDKPEEISFKAFKKSIELDGTGGEYAKLSQQGMKDLSTNALSIGGAYYEAENYSKALNSFILAQKLTPDNASAYLFGAYAAEALEDYQKVKNFYLYLKDNLNHKTAEVFMGLASIYEYSDKNSEKALKIIKEGRIALPNNQDIMVEEARLYQATGKIDEAIISLEKLIQKDPTNINFLNNLASFYDIKGEINKSIEYYKKAVDIKPNDFDANYNLAVMFYNKGAEIYEKTRDMDLGNYQREGVKLEKEANSYFEKAFPYFEKAYTINQDDKTTLTNLKMIYNTLKKRADEMRIDELLKSAGK